MTEAEKTTVAELLKMAAGRRFIARLGAATRTLDEVKRLNPTIGAKARRLAQSIIQTEVLLEDMETLDDWVKAVIASTDIDAALLEGKLEQAMDILAKWKGKVRR